MPQVSHYTVLGVSRTASQREIRDAYLKLSIAHHPDKNNNSKESTERFISINQAFKVLIDPSSRAAYDFDTNQRQPINLRPQTSTISEVEFNAWINEVKSAVHGNNADLLSTLLQQKQSMYEAQLSGIGKGTYTEPRLDREYSATEIDLTFQALLADAASSKGNEIAILLIQSGIKINFEHKLTSEYHEPSYFLGVEGVNCTLLQMTAFFDNFALVEQIGFDNFDLKKTLHCKYGEYENPLRELFWLNLICHWAIKNNASEWLQSLLQKEPSFLAESTIKKYLKYAEPMTQIEYKAELKKIHLQQQFDSYIAPHLAQLVKGSHTDNHKEILAILGREGAATSNIINKYENLYNAFYRNAFYLFCAVVGPVLLAFSLGMHRLAIYRRENLGTNEDESKFVPLMIIGSLGTSYAAFLLLNTAIARIAKAKHGEDIDIAAAHEDIALRAYQSYLLTNILKETNTINDEPQIAEAYPGISQRTADCFRTMFNRHRHCYTAGAVDHESDPGIDETRSSRAPGISSISV